MREGVESRRRGAWRLKGEHRLSQLDKKMVLAIRAAQKALASSRLERDGATFARGHVL